MRVPRGAREILFSENTICWRLLKPPHAREIPERSRESYVDLRSKMTQSQVFTLFSRAMSDFRLESRERVGFSRKTDRDFAAAGGRSGFGALFASFLHFLVKIRNSFRRKPMDLRKSLSGNSACGISCFSHISQYLQKRALRKCNLEIISAKTAKTASSAS